MEKHNLEIDDPIVFTTWLDDTEANIRVRIDQALFDTYPDFGFEEVMVERDTYEGRPILVVWFQRVA